MKATVIVAVLLFVVGAAPVSAHGPGVRHLGRHHSAWGVGYRSDVYFGIGHTRGYGHRRSHRRHRPGSSFSLSFHAPVYSTARRQAVVVEEQHVRSRRARALPDMPMLTYIAQSGQDTVTLTRDRRECERWAWRETRPEARGTMLRTLHTEQVTVAGRHRSSILQPAVGGAALGAIGGAIAGDVGAGAAIGALFGATTWLLNGGSAAHRETIEREVHVSEYVPAAGPNPNALRDALTSCMQARSYAVQ